MQRTARSARMSEASSGEGSHLAALGTGGRDDRLHFRLVLKLLVRCLALLRPVRRHVAALFGAFGALALLLLPLGLTLFDSFWTRALQGQPLLPVRGDAAAASTPRASSTVAALDVALRREVLARVIVFGAVVGDRDHADRDGALLLPGLDPAAREPDPAPLAARPLPEPLAALPRRLARRRRDLPDVPGQRDGDAAHRGAVPRADLHDRALTCSASRTMAIFDPLLALLLAVLWPPFLGARHLVLEAAAAAASARAREAESALTSSIQETLAGIKVIKAYGAEARRAAALRGGEPRRLRGGLRGAQPLRELPGLPVLDRGDRDGAGGRARRDPHAGAATRSRSRRSASRSGTSASSTT